MTSTPPNPHSREQRAAESGFEKKRRARGRPSLAHAAELREAFLEAATRSFVDKGYTATSIEAIARESGVAKITIYRHFANKQALFGEVIRRTLDSALEEIRAALGGDSSNIRERLLEMIEGMYEVAEQPRTLGLMRLAIAETSRFPELFSMVDVETIQALRPLVHLLEVAHHTGELNVPCPEHTAVQIAALSIGGIQTLLFRPLTSMRERREWAIGTLDLVLRGLSPRVCPTLDCTSNSAAS